ncbi:MAG: PilT/PilU family type 4a pilus ATPase [Acidiferrobacterales bacterium]|nr:PilT/PilU family type 4a pilus ATPase [Acidiferrobacterales bacterium]
MIELVDLLELIVRLDASDVFVTTGAPVSIKVNGSIRAVNSEVLNHDDTREFAYSIMNEEQRRSFEETKESNFAVHPPKIGRFRVNVFIQRGNVGVVMRKINIKIPTFEELKLPPIMPKIAMQKRGLVIMVGGTGTGKSTTQAAMIGHRNSRSHDHIITIEDPIEFLHPHKKSLITQREVGIDTDSFATALKNSMRQAPDVIQIGEIRDAETMHNAIVFAETGHLCMATLHANNTYQALDRIINFFPEGRKSQLLMDLSMNLHALVSQRLIPTSDGQGRVAAIEVMINTPLIADIIMRGEIHKIPDVIERSREIGLQSFDQALFDLYCADMITAEEALRNAESENNLRLKIKLEGPQAGKKGVSDMDTELLAF